MLRDVFPTRFAVEGFGGKAEMTVAQRVEHLKEEVVAGRLESAQNLASDPNTEIPSTPAERESGTVERILRESLASPRFATVQLLFDIEAELKRLGAEAGMGVGHRRWKPPRIAEELASRGILSAGYANATSELWQLRNQLAHGANSSEQTTMDAIESAVLLLATLRQLTGEKELTVAPTSETEAQ
jgi:hypothetical protein